MLMKYDRSHVTIFVLAILLILAVGYIISERITAARANELINISQRAYYAGVYDTVSALYAQTENCGVAEVNLVNVTREVVDVGCIKSGTPK